LAGENRGTFIPTPFKRWHGIRAQPRFSGDSCVKNVVNNSILVQVKNKTWQEVLRTYSDNAVIHLKYGGVESTARKSNETKYEVAQQEVGSATVVPARSTLVEKESLYSCT
jgi:hypothetical protein